MKAIMYFVTTILLLSGGTVVLADVPSTAKEDSMMAVYHATIDSLEQALRSKSAVDSCNAAQAASKGTTCTAGGEVKTAKKNHVFGGGATPKPASKKVKGVIAGSNDTIVIVVKVDSAGNHTYHIDNSVTNIDNSVTYNTTIIGDTSFRVVTTTPATGPVSLPTGGITGSAPVPVGRTSEGHGFYSHSYPLGCGHRTPRARCSYCFPNGGYGYNHGVSGCGVSAFMYMGVGIGWQFSLDLYGWLGLGCGVWNYRNNYSVYAGDVVRYQPAHGGTNTTTVSSFVPAHGGTKPGVNPGFFHGGTRGNNSGFNPNFPGTRPGAQNNNTVRGKDHGRSPVDRTPGKYSGSAPQYSGSNHPVRYNGSDAQGNGGGDNSSRPGRLNQRPTTSGSYGAETRTNISNDVRPSSQPVRGSPSVGGRPGNNGTGNSIGSQSRPGNLNQRPTSQPVRGNPDAGGRQQPVGNPGYQGSRQTSQVHTRPVITRTSNNSSSGGGYTQNRGASQVKQAVMRPR